MAEDDVKPKGLLGLALEEEKSRRAAEVESPWVTRAQASPHVSRLLDNKPEEEGTLRGKVTDTPDSDKLRRGGR